MILTFESIVSVIILLVSYRPSLDISVLHSYVQIDSSNMQGIGLAKILYVVEGFFLQLGF